MGWVHQADYLFVCFGAKPKQRAWTRDLRRDQKWGRKGGSERSQRAIGEGRRRGAVDNGQQKVAGEDGSRAEKGVNWSQKGDY